MTVLDDGEKIVEGGVRGVRPDCAKCFLGVCDCRYQLLVERERSFTLLHQLKALRGFLYLKP